MSLSAFSASVRLLLVVELLKQIFMKQFTISLHKILTCDNKIKKLPFHVRLNPFSVIMILLSDIKDTLISFPFTFKLLFFKSPHCLKTRKQQGSISSIYKQSITFSLNKRSNPYLCKCIKVLYFKYYLAL